MAEFIEPAFPANELNADGTVYQQFYGLNMRDYFAAKALASCIGHSPRVDAARAYEYADAMLAARATPPKNEG